MDMFLKQMKNRATRWTQKGEHDLDEFPGILRAYHQANTDGEYDYLVNQLEEYAIKNFISFTPLLAA